MDRNDSLGISDLDVERPNVARMYDYYLGGSHNFEADRRQAELAIAHYPDLRRAARANRAFLGNAVRRCLDWGIDQFLDLGSGVPTAGNVHEIAHARDPKARVAYVDVEPVAAAHAAEVIAEHGADGTVTITRADIREPRSVLSAPGVSGLLDFTRPVALLTVAVLHFIDDQSDVAGFLQRYHDVMAPGSAHVLSHSSDDQDDEELASQVRAANTGYSGGKTASVLRNRNEILALLEGLELSEPGLVDVSRWPQPGTVPGPAVGVYGGVGRVLARPRPATTLGVGI